MKDIITICLSIMLMVMSIVGFIYMRADAELFESVVNNLDIKGSEIAFLYKALNAPCIQADGRGKFVYDKEKLEYYKDHQDEFKEDCLDLGENNYKIVISTGKPQDLYTSKISPYILSTGEFPWTFGKKDVIIDFKKLVNVVDGDDVHLAAFWFGVDVVDVGG